MDTGDYQGLLTVWRAKFAGREDSLEATWELGELEERSGDFLFYGGEPGGAKHYYGAMRALIPQGSQFSSGEEHDRRMQAYTRLSNKLYAVGPDGRARPQHDAQPHPAFNPVVRAPEPVKAERREKVQRVRRARSRQETEFGRLHGPLGHHHHYSLGQMWIAAARAMAFRYPPQAHTACDWSRHFFELYNKEWTANLPASRWDSDGAFEITEAMELQATLTTPGETSPPKWVDVFIAGDLQQAIAHFPAEPPPAELEPLAAILADSRKLTGRP